MLARGEPGDEQKPRTSGRQGPRARAAVGPPRRGGGRACRGERRSRHRQDQAARGAHRAGRRGRSSHPGRAGGRVRARASLRPCDRRRGPLPRDARQPGLRTTGPRPGGRARERLPRTPRPRRRGPGAGHSHRALPHPQRGAGAARAPCRAAADPLRARGPPLGRRRVTRADHPPGPAPAAGRGDPRALLPHGPGRPGDAQVDPGPVRGRRRHDRAEGRWRSRTPRACSGSSAGGPGGAAARERGQPVLPVGPGARRRRPAGAGRGRARPSASGCRPR